MKKPEKLYEFHVANLQAVELGFHHVLGAGRLALASGNEAGQKTYLRLGALLLGAWAETRLLKLVHESGAFSPDERTAIIHNKALERWLVLVEVSFRRHYKIPTAKLQQPALTSSASSQLTILNKALDEDVRPIVTLRNKLAHGQWAYPLNDDVDDVAQTQMDELRKETLLSLTQKFNLINAICAAVHDLAVSLPTFKRDWDAHFHVVEQTRVNLQRRSYETWATHLKERYQRGAHRRTAPSTVALPTKGGGS